MKILIKTPVEKNYQIVFSRFNRELFLKLKPPFSDITLKRFDGCKKGDAVELDVKIFGIRQQWKNDIVEDFKNDYEITFVDVGVVMPPPLKSWKHTHRILKMTEISSVIVDDIEYSTNNVLLDLLLYFPFKIMFICRRPIYKRELS